MKFPRTTPVNTLENTPEITPSESNGQNIRSEEDTTDVFFRGVVSKITFKNEENGFGVLKADADPGIDMGSSHTLPTTVVGVMPPNLAIGANIIARGHWQTHPKFGRQFRARSMTESEPTGKDAIFRYLASGAIKGFGPVLSKRIVDAFGEETLAILDSTPERLREVSGIGERKFQELTAAWQEKKNLREVLLFFQTHNIPLSLAHRIYNFYGDRAIEKVSANPYVLAKDIWGIGFQTADKIAMALGLAVDSKERIVAGLLYTLKRGADDGHCFIPQELLIAKTSSLLGIADETLLIGGLNIAVSDEELVRSGENIYQLTLFEAETSLAESLADRIRSISEPRTTINPGLIEHACAGTSINSSNLPRFQLSQQQQEAVQLAATKTLVVITGGPGCGKTTVLRTIAGLFQRAGQSVQLCAPTGRAAQRLAEVCGIKASTIHRMLKFDPISRSFVHNKDTPLASDVVIVDESSMIDVPLAASLLSAIPTGTRVVIVGDADQLPSVGPGLFLAELLSTSSIPRVRLTTLFRRANESSITSIAHQINSAIVPDIPEPDGNTKSDAYFLKAVETQEVANLVERLVVDQIPKRFKLSGSQIMVLAPMNQGEIGVISLNQRLQSLLVPPRSGLPCVKIGNIEFRLGDRVCQRVNNYQLHSAGVFNGDQGEITAINIEDKSITVKLWDDREVVYPSDSLYQLDLAYALTIHRSQGSEVPAVVLVLHESHSILLERQLIYTAVTRAKQLLIIVGTRRALTLATKRSRSKRRFTALNGRILEAMNR